MYAACNHIDVSVRQHHSGPGRPALWCGLSLLHSLLLPAGGLRKSYTTTAVARERKGGHIETKREERQIKKWDVGDPELRGVNIRPVFSS